MELHVAHGAASSKYLAEGLLHAGFELRQDLADGASDVRLDRQPVDGGKRAVDPDIPQIAVPESQTDRGLLEQHVEQRVGRRQTGAEFGLRSFRQPLRRQVTRHQHGAARGTGCRRDRGGGDLQEPRCAFGPDLEYQRLVAYGCTAAQHGRDHTGGRRLTVLRLCAPHPLKRLTLSIGVAPARQLFGDRIEEHDATARVSGDDCIADAGQDRMQPFALLAQQHVGGCEFAGSGSDPDLEILLDRTQFGILRTPLQNLGFELSIGRAQLGGAGQRQQPRHQVDKRHRRDDRDERRRRLDDAGEPVERVPQRQDSDQVGEATGHDEHAKSRNTQLNGRSSRL